MRFQCVLCLYFLISVSCFSQLDNTTRTIDEKFVIMNGDVIADGIDIKSITLNNETIESWDGVTAVNEIDPTWSSSSNLYYSKIELNSETSYTNRANTFVKRDTNGNIIANSFIGDGSGLTNISSTSSSLIWEVDLSGNLMIAEEIIATEGWEYDEDENVMPAE